MHGGTAQDVLLETPLCDNINTLMRMELEGTQLELLTLKTKMIEVLKMLIGACCALQLCPPL